MTTKRLIKERANRVARYVMTHRNWDRMSKQEVAAETARLIASDPDVHDDLMGMNE